MLRSFYFILPIFFILAGCALIDNNPQPVDTGEAFLFPSCGPADGAALDIIIPKSQGNSCRDVELIYLKPWSQTFTRIYITQFPDEYVEDGLTPFYFGLEVVPDSVNGSGGWAGFCEDGVDQCIEANRGVIELPRPLQQSGLFDSQVNIEFNDGSSINERMQLQACEHRRPLLCG